MSVPRVDPIVRRLYVAALGIAVLGGGCASTGAASGEPDPQAEARLESATTPARRAQVFFDWNMTDRDARFSGRGVLRLDAGHRARVDLFGPRGETLAAAIVEAGAMRVVPPGADAMLPPPALLWASLGVFRRPADIPLTGTSVTGDDTSLRYTRDATTWQFTFHQERLSAAEWTDGSGRRTVELKGEAPLGLPREALFRDWSAFRELTLRVTEVEETAAFEADVWVLPGER